MRKKFTLHVSYNRCDDVSKYVLMCVECNMCIKNEVARTHKVIQHIKIMRHHVFMYDVVAVDTILLYVV